MITGNNSPFAQGAAVSSLPLGNQLLPYQSLSRWIGASDHVQNIDPTRYGSFSSPGSFQVFTYTDQGLDQALYLRLFDQEQYQAHHYLFDDKHDRFVRTFVRDQDFTGGGNYPCVAALNPGGRHSSEFNLSFNMFPLNINGGKHFKFLGIKPHGLRLIDHGQKEQFKQAKDSLPYDPLGRMALNLTPDLESSPLLRDILSEGRGWMPIDPILSETEFAPLRDRILSGAITLVAFDPN